jgi:predicted enzyme related to lactoylglutathione lyase
MTSRFDDQRGPATTTEDATMSSPKGRFVWHERQGAVFCLYTPARHTPPPEGPCVGEFSWHELATTDPKAGLAFYSTLFGWRSATEYDMGPAGIYQLFDLGGPPLGGIYAKPSHVPVSSWLPYAMVSSADDAAARATTLGGTIIVPPMEVPGGDRIAVGMDPQGAVFAVHARKG